MGILELLFGLWLATTVMAFACDAEKIAKYDFQSIKGVYSAVQSKKTPPSVSETTWSLGICDRISDIPECKDSELCGTTRVTLDGETFVTQVIKVHDVAAQFLPILKSKSQSGIADKDNGGVRAEYNNIKWGDQRVKVSASFMCPGIDYVGDLDSLSLSSFSNTEVKLEMYTKAACANKQPHKHKADDGESWGWFTWIFIFFVLFLSIYIIGGAWFQYNKGNSIDFQTALKEVVENFVDVIKGLPIFVKEIIEKFTGNANRGEYSAV